jgi:hypothetical protein
MQCVLFDDRGEAWDVGSTRLAEALQSSITGEELANYAVRNLGFVAVSEDDRAARIRLRPAVVSPIALSALLYWLHDHDKDRFVLSSLDGQWSHEVVGARDEVVRKLTQRIGGRAPDREGDFLQQQRPLHQLSQSSPLRAMLDIWSDCNGKYDLERLRPLLEKALEGRFVLVEAAPSASNLFIKEIGSGLRKPAGQWLARSIGLRVEDQPDYAYGKWVARAYRHVIDSGEPDLGDVDAVISWPQQSRQSFRYKRLLLPFRREDNSAVLLGASLADPSIDLRVKAS